MDRVSNSIPNSSHPAPWPGHEEPEALELRGTVSTNGALKKTLSSALPTRYPLELRGDDRSERELHRAHKERNVLSSMWQSVKDGAHAYELASGVNGGIGLAVGQAAATASSIAALAATVPVTAGAVMLREVNVDAESGKERARAVDVDKLHMGLVDSLELPADFAKAEIARYGQQSDVRSARDVLRDRLSRDYSAQRAVLQLLCDRGMNAARESVELGVDRAQYLSTRPEVRGLYESDAAFRLGFDAVLFTKAQGDENQYRETIEALEKRDAWYTSHEVRCRA